MWSSYPTQEFTTTSSSFFDYSTPSLDAETGHSRLKSGAIAGVVIGALAVAALLLLGGLLAWKRYRRSKYIARNSTSDLSLAVQSCFLGI